MEWQDGIAGGAGQPDRARLRDSSGASRPVQRESGGLAEPHVSNQLQHRPAPATRGGTTCRTVAESLDDSCDPFPVEIFARDDHDSPATKVIGRSQDTAVPEGHHRLAAACDNSVEMLEAVYPPTQ